MGTGALRTDQIVQIEGIPYRMLRMVSDSCWQLEQQKTLRVVEFEKDDLLSMVADNKLTFPATINGPRSVTAHSDIPKELLEAAKIRRMYVLPALNVPNTRRPLEQVIDEVWNRLHLPKEKPGYISLYRWKLRYQQSGGDYRVLVDNNRAKGNRTCRFEDDVIALSTRAIKERYMTLEGRNVQKTLEHAMEMFRSENEARPKDFKLTRPPSRRLIKHLIEEIPAYDRHLARKGLVSARREFRSVRGKIIAEAPLERAEIDHTELDLVVLDDRTLQVLGRPWVTACIDVYSRCVLGIYIGFIDPSEQSVARCLKDCLRPKSAEAGIRNKWTAFGKMHELVVDNGLEFHANRLEQVCLSLNIDLRYSPRKQPWFKGHIERFFGTLNQFVHGIPGTTFSNTTEKGEYESNKEACITLSEARNIIRKWIVDDYHQRPHRGIGTTPAKLWNNSIEEAQIEFPDVSVDLDFIMAKSETRVLSHKGIEYEGLFYNSDELRQLRNRIGDRTKVEIRVDEDNLSSIYVLDPGSSKRYSVPASETAYAKDISLIQHKMYRNWARDKGNTKPDSADCMAAREEIERMIEESSAMNKRKLQNQKRVARLREEGERAQAKAREREQVTTQESRPDLWPAGSRNDSTCEQKFPPRTVGENNPTVAPANFKAIYKKGQ